MSNENPIYDETVRGEFENNTDVQPQSDVVIDEEVEINDGQIFLPLVFRQILYIVALAASVAGPVVSIADPELAQAIITGAGILNVAAVGTALANPKRS